LSCPSSLILPFLVTIQYIIHFHFLQSPRPQFRVAVFAHVYSRSLLERSYGRVRPSLLSCP
jgi:hypothetical protein